MSICIERVINNPINSNCFILYKKDNSSCLIIDPGSFDCSEIIRFLNNNNLVPEYILLTHEHFDHIGGVNIIKDKYCSKIVSSKICAVNIISKKKNLSVFYNQIGFETYSTDIIVENKSIIQWNGSQIYFIESQGHTDGSQCILIDNYLFTGDTIIKDQKTVIKLPGGNKSKLKESLELLYNRLYGKQIIIHAGHGESFCFDELNAERLV